MTKNEILECLINHYTDGNKARFANMLGVKPQTINSWLSRGTFDIDLIYSKCEALSGDWLLSGEGNMIKNPHFANTSNNNANQDLLELCKLLIANYQQRDEVMNKLVSMVKGME